MINQISARVLTIVSVLDAITSGNLFSFAAKKTAWPDEDNPPAPADVTLSAIMADVLFSKRVDNKDIRFLVPRVNWITATAYALGDVIMTAENHVYLCTTAGTSQTAPTHVTGTQVESPGSVGWKFLETVSPAVLTVYGDSGSWTPLSFASEEIFWTAKPTKIRIAFSIIGDENSFFPLAQSYRVVGVYANPFLRAVRNKITDSSDFTKYGALFGINTMTPIMRTADQVDQFVFDVDLPA